MIQSVIKELIFFMFAFSAIFSAIVVVTTRYPVKGILCLVLCFVAMAGIWLMLQAEFLALILVVVYVGAVMTLFLFVVMMLNLERESLKRSFVRYMPVGLVVTLLILIMLYVVLGPKNLGLQNYPAPQPVGADYSSVRLLGMTLYTDFLYAFEVAGALLLTAMVAAISLSYRGQRKRRVTRTPDQLKVRPEERIHLVKMKTTKRDS